VEDSSSLKEIKKKKGKETSGIRRNTTSRSSDCHLNDLGDSKGEYYQGEIKEERTVRRRGKNKLEVALNKDPGKSDL